MKVSGKKLALIVAVAVCFIPGMVLAGVGPGNGTGPIHNVLSGTPFTYTGDVATLNGKGDGFTLVTVEGGTVKIFGLAPDWYWESLGYERPAVGDTITVQGYAVDFDGVTRNIAMSITITVLDEAGNEVLQEVMLRDPATGLPLWKAIQQKIKMNQNQAKKGWSSQP